VIGRSTWRPLAGVRVVDLTSMLPGGTATRLLADLGAEVTKIEPPAGDPMRRLKPSVGPDSSAQHRYLDHGKDAVFADLKDERGREIVRQLASHADAVIEGFRPGVADRLGVGYRALAEGHESLVYVSLSGYGQSGPRADAAGHDLNFAALAGLVGRGEELPPALAADVSGGMLAALGLTAAIFAARTTGRGTHLDLALADAALVVAGMGLAGALAGQGTGDAVVTPLDGRSPCYRLYRARDGRAVAVGALESKFWRTVVTLLDRPEWMDRQHDPTLTDEFAALIATGTGCHWADLLEGPDTCVTVARAPADLPDDPHLRARGALICCDGLWQVGSPFHRHAYSTEEEKELQSWNSA
jgi:alpha-methylacyl-CoA racemase